MAVPAGVPNRGSPRIRDYYLILWWYNQAPCGALFLTPDFSTPWEVKGFVLDVEAVAKERNAVVIHLRGTIDSIGADEWWRRSEDGKPMPIRWFDLPGSVKVPK